MAVSRKAITRKGVIWRFIFAFIVITAGFLLNLFGIGKNYFLAYSSVGNYLIYIGILIIFITGIMALFKKDRIIDERIEKIALKSMAWVWYSIFIGGFTIMILDGIKPINIGIGEFVAYSICAVLLVYIIAYKIFERRY